MKPLNWAICDSKLYFAHRPPAKYVNLSIFQENKDAMGKTSQNNIFCPDCASETGQKIENTKILPK